jgi:hypothetical protein
MGRMRGRRDAQVMTLVEGSMKIALELTAVVRLPDQIAPRHSASVEMTPDWSSDAGVRHRASPHSEGMRPSPDTMKRIAKK